MKKEGKGEKPLAEKDEGNIRGKKKTSPGGQIDASVLV